MSNNKIGVVTTMMVILLLSITSCKKKKEAAEIPTLEFLSTEFVANNNELLITVHFIDGNGDIGLGDNDTLEIYNCVPDPLNPNLCTNLDYYNYLITSYRRENNEWTDLGETRGISRRLKRFAPAGQDQYIEGNFEHKINPYDSNQSGDSIKYEIFIKDRALNHSNIVETGLIILP